MQFFIDDEGVELAGHELRRRFRSKLAPDGLATHVVVNFGYVAVALSGDTARLCLRPCVVSQVTLAALLFWLGDRSIDRAVISHYAGTWQHEVIGPFDAIVERVGNLVADPLVARQGDFRRHRQSGCHAALEPLLRLWHHNSGKPFSDPLRASLRDNLQGRYMILKLAPWSRRLEILDVGHGFLVYNDAWLANAIGRRFEDQPDHAYGRWAAETYYEASLTEQPLVDNVDALIHTPGRGKVRLQYQRVVLPHRVPRGGDHLLLCASLLDQSIDLRDVAA